MCMSVAERIAVADAWLAAAAAAGGALKILIHVGSESVADMQALCKHAEGTAAVAISAHCTTFNKPSNAASIVALLHTLSVAAPTKPLYLYAIGVKTGVSIPCEAVLLGPPEPFKVMLPPPVVLRLPPVSEIP